MKSFNFDLFYRMHVKITEQPLTYDWLTWFIGFSEGEASFSLAKRGDVSFVITQSLHNVDILYNIQQRLGFGRVVLQSKRLKAARWVVQDAFGLRILILLFNGNLVLKSRQLQFSRWCEGYNRFLQKPRLRRTRNWGPKITCIMARPKIHHNDAWLAGFSDGEACFHARFRKAN